jgi:hypothetical protein
MSNTADRCATVTLWFSLFAFGCADSSPGSGDRFEFRDSLGVEIVDNGFPLLDGARRWTVSSDPDLQIGAVEGDDPYLFTSIWDAVRAPDGRVVVADGRDYDIRVFGADGVHQTSFGQQGDGPNDFGGPPWLALAGNDTLVVWDPGHYRLSWFGLDGSLFRQVSLQPTISSLSITRFVNGLVWETASDGGLLWTGPGDLRRAEDGLNDSMRSFVLIDNEGTAIHDFGTFPWGQTFATRRADGVAIGIGNPFAPSTAGALGPSPHRFAVASNDAWDIRLYEASGELTRILRASIARRAVTNDMVAVERDSLPRLALGMGLTLGETERAFDQIPVPDSLPPIAALYWDALGDLWVGRRAGRIRSEREYDVFDSSGRWQTTVQVPDDMGRIHEIGARYILATWYDSLGVAYLRVYGINKPAG